MNERPDAPERLPLQELVGTALGEYRIRRILGHGSMGVVFEAWHEKLDRRVALKALPPGLGATEKAIQRFLREAQAVAQLTHEHIVPIYEIAQSGPIHWYAMRFLDGEPLDRLAKRGPLDPVHAARLVETAARAVHFAHQRGIIHRDLKPANMILDGDGRLVLTDFGLARPEQAAAITDSGAMVGTPLYMSPEQVRARKGEIDRRTDVWSLGATLYELVAGAPPFRGETTQEILQAILDTEPRSPRALRPDLPADLELIVLKALEKDPRNRYASALALAQDLERFTEGEPITARRSIVLVRAVRRLRRHKAIVAMAAAVALVVVAWGLTGQRSRRLQLERDYKSSIEQAKAQFEGDNLLAAIDQYAKALEARPGDLDALLGRAQALCFLGTAWERDNASAGGEALPALAARFGSVDRLFADALDDLAAVMERVPDHPLATFYRGFIRWRSGETLKRVVAFEDLLRADKLGADDWETQLELAQFRFGLALDPRRASAEAGELLQTALSYATRAVQLLDRERSQGSTLLLERRHVKALKLRADLYQQLYEKSGNLRTYLELAHQDATAALAIDARDTRAAQMQRALHDALAAPIEDPAPAGEPVASGPPAPSGGGDLPELARSVLKLFDEAPMSEKSRQLFDVLKLGGEAIAPIVDPLVAGAGELQAGLVDRFVNPYLGGAAAVSDVDRKRAETSAAAGRRLLQAAATRGEVQRADREKARDLFRAAIAANPRNAQYHFELAVVEQELDELPGARSHLEEAVRIAPGNPLFFCRLALVCEAQREYATAAQHARSAARLAPGIAEFQALEARLAALAAREIPAAGDGGS